MTDEYVLVRLDDNIPDDAVLVYDATNDKLTSSGLTAKEGSIQAEAGTVKVGLHNMSSEGEQVSWTNRESGITYSPPWHIIDEVNPGGSYDRIYGPLQEITRFTVNDAVLENPRFPIIVDFDEVVFRNTFEAVEAHPNAELRVIGPNGETVWRELLVLSVGVQEYTFLVPNALKTGSYELELHDYNTGTPVRVKGNGQTGEMAYSLKARAFTDKPLALLESVDAVKSKAFNIVITPNVTDDEEKELNGEMANYIIVNHNQAPTEEPYSIILPATTMDLPLIVENIGTYPFSLVATSPVTIEGSSLYTVEAKHKAAFVYDSALGAWRFHYDNIMEGAGATKFTDLTDTPNNYTPPWSLVMTNGTASGITYREAKLESLVGDMNITNPEPGDLLYYTGSQWQNEKPIPDVSVAGILQGRIVGQIDSHVSNYVYVDSGSEFTGSMPDAYDGHWLWVVNYNTAIDDIVQLNLRSGTTLDGGSGPFTVNQLQQRLAVFSEANNEWSTVFNMPISDGSAPAPHELDTQIEIVHLKNGGDIGSVKPDTSTYLYKDSSNNRTIVLPQVLNDRNVFFWANNDSLTPMQLSAPTGTTIDDTHDFVTVPSKTQTLLRYGGNFNWQTIFLIASDNIESLEALTDVSIANPANGQVLTFKDGDWVNEALPAAQEGIQASNDGVNFTPLKGLYVKANPLTFQSDIGEPDLFTIGFNGQGYYEKPVNAMYIPQGPITLQQQGDQTAELLFFNEPMVSDARVKVNEPLNGYTLEAVKAIPTLYFVRAEIYSESLVIAPPTGDHMPVTYSIVDMTTVLPTVGGTPLLDVTGKPLSVDFRAHADQEFGRHVLEGVISVSGTPVQLGIQVKCQLGDELIFNPDTNNRITITQINDPDNKASIASLLEGQLSGGVSTQRSFVLGGDFLSQPFDLGATQSVQTLNQGSQVRVANGWWLDAVVDGCNYQRTSGGLAISGAGNGGVFLPELHHVIDSDTSKAFAQRNERLTFTIKARYDEPVYLYVLGWNGAPDEVPSSILTGYQNANHTYIPNIQKLGMIELLKDGVGFTEKTDSVSVTVPTGINNLVVSVTSKQIYPNDITIEAVKGEAGEEFTGWQVSDIQDNEPFAFGAAQVDTADTSYALEDTNAATLPLNTLITDRPREPFVILDDAGDYLIFAQRGRYMFSYQLEFYRVNNTGGTVQYGVWLEESTDGGVNWTPIQGSGSRLTVPSQAAGGVRTICCAFPYVTDNVNNTLIRGRHAVTNAGAGIEVRSFAASGVFPVAPAWRFSGVKL